MSKPKAAAVLVCAALLCASIVSPAIGGPSIGQVAKQAKKALRIGKSAKRTANTARRTANTARNTANGARALAAFANGKADQALASAITAGGITEIVSPTSFVPPFEVGSAQAFCPGGQRVISGGGAMISGLGDGLAVSEANDTRTGWFVIAVNNSEFTTAELEAIAYCVPAGQAVAAGNSRAKARAEVAAAERRLRAKVE